MLSALSVNKILGLHLELLETFIICWVMSYWVETRVAVWRFVWSIVFMNCKTCGISLVWRGKNSFLFALYCGVFLIRYMPSQCSLNRIVFKAGVQVCFCTIYFCCHFVWFWKKVWWEENPHLGKSATDPVTWGWTMLVSASVVMDLLRGNNVDVHMWLFYASSLRYNSVKIM